MLMTSKTIISELPAHHEAIETLAADAFGPGRFAKTAYRLRQGQEPVPGLSFVALEGEAVIGSVRFTLIGIGPQPGLLLGPLVVHPDHKSKGFGQALMRTGLDAAQAQGYALAILMGDAPYYARAGFGPVPPGQMILPGPVDPTRLLAAELVDGALARAVGAVVPR